MLGILIIQFFGAELILIKLYNLSLLTLLQLISISTLILELLMLSVQMVHA